eukprot:1640584-Lingulodinium_polyedra.AAC.1
MTPNKASIIQRKSAQSLDAYKTDAVTKAIDGPEHVVKPPGRLDAIPSCRANAPPDPDGTD